MLGPGRIRLRLVIAVLLAAGCAEPGADDAVERAAGEAVAVSDAAGRTVRLASPARRIVSLVPAATDLVLALGAGDRLIARTTYDTDPRLAELPSVGGGLTPSLEGIASLRPELVIAWRDSRDRDLVARLGDLGIAVYAVRIRTLDEIDGVTRDLGALLGRAASADSLVDTIDRGLAEVRAAVRDRARPAVLYLVWGDPPITTGDGTFVGEVIRIAGGRNVFADVERAWPEVAVEAIVQRRPDVILMPGGDASGPAMDELRGRPGWSELDAVREGRVIRLDADLFNRPGPCIAEAARTLARQLHPSAFAVEARR